MTEAIALGRPQRRARTPPTSAWSTPSSRRSRSIRSSGVFASPWILLRISRVGVDQHELADIVQQRGGREPIASVVLKFLHEAIAGDPGGSSMEAEAIRNLPPGDRTLEEVKRLGPVRDSAHHADGKCFDGLGHGLDVTAARPG